MTRVELRRAGAIAGSIIALIILTLFSASFALSSALQLPPSLDFPLPVRALGGAILAAGIVLAGWLFRYRSPTAMMVSTYFTLSKMFFRAPVSEPSGRTEQLLVLSGPQKYVRHPLYSGIILMILGWALVTATTWLLVSTVVATSWFRLVQIPFEERELRALFGERYTKYSREVPMLIPFRRRMPT